MTQREGRSKIQVCDLQHMGKASPEPASDTGHVECLHELTRNMLFLHGWQLCRAPAVGRGRELLENLGRAASTKEK